MAARAQATVAPLSHFACVAANMLANFFLPNGVPPRNSTRNQ